MHPVWTTGGVGRKVAHASAGTTHHDQIGVRWVANELAIQQAVEKTDATRIITFHSRVNLAKVFASPHPNSSWASRRGPASLLVPVAAGPAVQSQNP
jgi:hypothetical protein